MRRGQERGSLSRAIAAVPACQPSGTSDNNLRFAEGRSVLSSPRIIPVLLAGGSGTRLWPVSRDTMPKQFLPLMGDRSTYQQALMRVADAVLFAPPIVMTSADFRFFARRQAEELGIEATIVLEPDRRDSGPPSRQPRSSRVSVIRRRW